MTHIACDLCLQIINTQDDETFLCLKCDCLFCKPCVKKISQKLKLKLKLNLGAKKNDLKSCLFCCSDTQHRIITEEEIINYCLSLLNMTREEIESQIKTILKDKINKKEKHSSTHKSKNINKKIKIDLSLPAHGSQDSDSASSFMENLSPQENESESEYQEFTEISDDSDS